MDQSRNSQVGMRKNQEQRVFIDPVGEIIPKRDHLPPLLRSETRKKLVTRFDVGRAD